LAKAGIGARQQKPGSFAWLQGLCCGAALAFATAAAFTAVVLLMPVIAVFCVEPPGKRPVTRAVFLNGLMFSLEPVAHVVSAGGTMAAALNELSDPAAIALAWLAGATGWALCEVLPMLIAFIGEFQAKRGGEAMQAEIDALKAEWGIE
jgi:hypothetical protein